jgi:hypothetical protein
VSSPCRRQKFQLETNKINRENKKFLVRTNSGVPTPRIPPSLPRNIRSDVEERLPFEGTFCDFWGTNIMDLPKNRLCGDDNPGERDTENPLDDCRLQRQNRIRYNPPKDLIINNTKQFDATFLSLSIFDFPECSNFVRQ